MTARKIAGLPRPHRREPSVQATINHIALAPYANPLWCLLPGANLSRQAQAVRDAAAWRNSPAARVWIPEQRPPSKGVTRARTRRATGHL